MTEADLLRENAELTASRSQLRGHVRDISLRIAAGQFESASAVCGLALTEPPAASLAAITAPLEARIAELEGALTGLYMEIAKYQLIAHEGSNLLEVMSDAHKALTRTAAQSLAAIQDAARAEERKAIDAGLREIAFHVPVCFEQGGERYVSIEEVFALKRIAAEFRNRGNGGESKP